MDNLDFLDAGSPANAETQPPETTAEAPVEQPQAEQPETEAQVTETPEQQPTRERDEKGRFKAREEQPMVPLQALHETRDKVRDLESRLAAMTQPQQPQQAPDIFADPDGYTASLQNQFNGAIANVSLNISEEMARQQYGDETVGAVQQWAQQMFPYNPSLLMGFQQSRNPYGYLVGEYRRFQTVQQLGNADPKEIEAFLAWKNQQGQAAQQPAQASPQPPTPPRSIASAASAGGVQHQAMGPGVAFGNVIK